MTTPVPRWTTETEELVARALESPCVCHFVDIGVGYQKAAEDPTCPRCTLFGQTAAILTALADAGVLVAPGGETRQEIEVQDDALRYPCGDMAAAWRQFGELKAKGYDAHIVQRTIHIGPWREVTDGD